jgi:CubicO group peptidase (beta-lactamase class C family)
MPKSTAWLAPALAYIPEYLAYQMRVSEQPGVSVAIMHEGKLVLEMALGHANLKTGEKLTPRHRFRVASHSKSFTAAAILKLRERGKLKLDDTAGMYVEGLHPEIAATTISQLLSHTAGIFRDGTDCAYWAGHAEFSDEAQIRKDLALPPAIEPNTRFKYSNHGFALAGLVIEAVTGESYTSWVAREIVAKAGLSETTPDVPHPAKAKAASGHSNKALLGKRVIFPGTQSTHALASATGFVSTAADLAKFFAQLHPKAAKSVLSVASRREMTRPQWKDAYSALDRSYGLGTIHGAHDGWAWWGHSGGFQGYITQTATVPARNITVSVLTNAVDGWAGLWLDGILSILKRFATEGAPEKSVADWTGRWWSSWGAVDLVPMGKKVLVAGPGFTQPFNKMSELEITGRDTGKIALAGGFASHGEPVHRIRGKGGKITAIRLAGGTVYPEATAVKDLAARWDK